MAGTVRALNPRVKRVAKRIYGEFHEMPGMRLTEAQVRRVWSLSPAECQEALHYLCDSCQLAHDSSGSYLLSSEPREAERHAAAH